MRAVLPRAFTLSGSHPKRDAGPQEDEEANARSEIGPPVAHIHVI